MKHFCDLFLINQLFPITNVNDSFLLIPFLNFYSYSRELPSRFKKDIIRAAKQNESEAEHIFLEGFQKVIANINMQHKVSHSDIRTIFYEIGDSSGKVRAERMLQML